jgi:sterol desaturase/sphingolipid hydroxylase (fatty acid hydroxylase superfamily)
VRRGSEIRTLAEAWRAFGVKTGPRIIGAGVVAALAARIAVGGITWRDPVAVAAMLAAYPLAEWLIHVYVLHLPPLRVRGRRVELPTAAAHRSHHEDPHRLDLVNLGPVEAIGLLTLIVPLVVGAGAGLVALTLGGVSLGPVVTAGLTGYVLVGVYEWMHFLIHTARRPRTAAFRNVARAHRLHHFKNEHAWFGVATTLGDRVMGTAPDPRDVPRSATARSLRG